MQCECIPATGANRIPFGQSGGADIIISTPGKTPERVKVIDFAMCCAPTCMGVFGPKKADVNDAVGLAGPW